MNKLFTYLFVGFLSLGLGTQLVQAQTTIAGSVKDVDTGEALIGVSVAVKGTPNGGVTDVNGNFSFSTNARFPFSLVFSSIGYSRKEVLINDESELNNFSISLGQITILADEVVISASRRAERITESPATINLITAADIQNLPSFNPGELLARQKGVDFVRSGVLGTGINVRGFNSTFNAKNLQLNDGRFSTLIATGLPLGALTPVIKEDIERVEIVLGPSSALYGPNAGNGLVNTITKDPRTSQGTTFAVGFGAQNVFSGRFRHAQTIGDKFAFKINGEYTRGEEFEYTDSVYVVGNPLTFNPAFNPEQPAGPLNNPTLGVSEFELDRTFESIKGDVSLYYSIDDDKDLIFSYLGSESSNLGVTNQGRNQIRDWQIHQFHLRYVSSNWFAQVYHTLSRTDSTFNLNQRTTNYYNLLAAATADDSEGGATITADEQVFARNNSFTNAVFTDNSERWNAELQYNNQFGNLNLVAGAQFQRDEADSRGTYLLDSDGEIIVNQIGVYAQVEYKFGTSGWKVVASARGDNHEFYGFNFVPKGAVLYTGDKGTWRLTYGLGIAAPTILNLEGNLFGGLILGNADGFTLSDGTVIDALEVEKTQTIEAGYKGQLMDRLFIDANAYYNFSRNFISPLTNIVPTGFTG
ncbi:MAG: carboxypeptidase-like regulatory domain-containing protein, partial [Bacteroidota bacterium]